VSLIHQVPAYLDEEYPIVISITNEDDRALDVILDILLQPSEIDEAGTQICVSMPINPPYLRHSERHPC